MQGDHQILQWRRLGEGGAHRAVPLVRMRASAAELTEVEGVGDVRARAIKEGLARLAESSILERYV